jgi:hypothetical protein
MAPYAFDGTWNEKKDNDDPDQKNTNVARFFAAYHQRSGKNDFYVPGVGTRWDVLGKVIGGKARRSLVTALRENRRAGPFWMPSQDIDGARR